MSGNESSPRRGKDLLPKTIIGWGPKSIAATEGSRFQEFIDLGQSSSALEYLTPNIARRDECFCGLGLFSDLIIDIEKQVCPIRSLRKEALIKDLQILQSSPGSSSII